MLSKEKINPSLKNTKRQGSDNLAAMDDPTSLKTRVTTDVLIQNQRLTLILFFIKPMADQLHGRQKRSDS